MTKIKLVLLISILAPSVTLAQSKVTLYGVIDEGINFTNNAGGGHQYNLSSSVLLGSRWGILGTEDLGGGLSAIFMLENGFDENSGSLGQKNVGSSQGLEFGRQAYVGLGNQFGTLTFGRQYDPLYFFVGAMEAAAQWGGTPVAHPGDLDGFGPTWRINNAISFKSTNYRGFTFSSMYSLGGVAGESTRNQIWSAAAGYSTNSLTIRAAYVNARNPNISFFGDNGASSPVTPASNYTSTPVYGGFASAQTYEVFAMGIAYTLGIATLGSTYSNTRFVGLGNTSASGPNPNGYHGTANFNDVEVSLKLQVTPSLILGAAANYTNGSPVSTSTGSNTGARYYQASLGADYYLSKRTDIYLTSTYQKASGTDSTGESAVAAITGLTPSRTDRQATIRLGICHRF